MSVRSLVAESSSPPRGRRGLAGSFRVAEKLRDVYAEQPQTENSWFSGCGWTIGSRNMSRVHLVKLSHCPSCLAPKKTNTCACSECTIVNLFETLPFSYRGTRLVLRAAHSLCAIEPRIMTVHIRLDVQYSTPRRCWQQEADWRNALVWEVGKVLLQTALAVHGLDAQVQCKAPCGSALAV